MNRLTPACTLVLVSLRYKFLYFRKKGKLQPDGTFFYDDKRLASETRLSERTVARAVHILAKHGYIRFERGKFKGWATHYRLTEKGVKLTGFFRSNKPNNSSSKPVDLSQEGRQKVGPNNKTNKEKNYMDDYVPLTNEQEKERQALMADFYKKLGRPRKK